MTIADKTGQMVPRTHNRVSYEISGPGEIVAIGNGDATSHESFQAKQQNAYNGLALVVVRTKAGQAGKSGSWRARTASKRRDGFTREAQCADHVRRALILSTATAARMTRPLTTCCQKGETLSRNKPLLSTPMIRQPSTAPKTGSASARQ